MGIVIRKSLVTTLFSYLGVVIGYLNILYLFPKFLSPSQIGFYRLILDSAILLAPFAQSGIMQGIIRYYPARESPQDKKEFELFSFLFFFLSVLFFCGLLILLKEVFLEFLFTDKLEQLSQFYDLLLFLIIILSTMAFYEGYARAQLHVVLVSFLKDVYVRILTAISVFLYFRDFLDYQELLYSLLVIYGSSALILFLNTSLRQKITGTTKFKNLHFKKMVEIIKYNFFMVLSAGSNLVVGKIDSLMISALLGFTENGIYTTLFYVAAVIEIPKRAISQIVISLFSKAFARQNSTEVQTLYAKTALNQLIIGLLIYIGIVINLDNLFFFIPNGEVYALGKWVVIIIGAAKVLDMAAGSNSELIIMSPYFRFNVLAISSLALLTILSNKIMIPIFGLSGAALASFTSFLIFNLVKLIFIYKKFGFLPFSRNTLKVLMIGGVSTIIGIYMPFMINPYVDLLVRSVLVAGIYMSLTLASKASEDINGFVSDLLNKLRK